MAEAVWHELPQHYPGVNVDAFVVMPNHVHGIILLEGAGADPYVNHVGAGAPARPAPTHAGQPQGVAPTKMMSLPDVVQRFKSLTTVKYRWGVRQDGWPPFPGRLWQRNYYEHVIRDEEELNRIRQYIVDNPQNWAHDIENPDFSPNAGINAPS